MADHHDHPDRHDGDRDDRHGREVLDGLTTLAAESARRMARIVVLVMACLERGLAGRLDGLPVEHVLGVTAGWTASGGSWSSPPRRCGTCRSPRGGSTGGSCRGARSGASSPRCATSTVTNVAGSTTPWPRTPSGSRGWVRIRSSTRSPSWPSGLEQIWSTSAPSGRTTRRSVTVQDGLFGEATMIASADRAAVEGILEAIDDAAHATDADNGEERRSVGRRRFDGLAHLASTHLAGGPQATGPAKPQINLVASPADLDPAAGEEAAAHGGETNDTHDGGNGSSTAGAGMPRWDSYGPPTAAGPRARPHPADPPRSGLLRL